MGYRSDVAYTIRFRDLGAMTLFIEEAIGRGLRPALDECDIVKNKLQINFFVLGVKWYDIYPEIQVHEALIALAGDWCEGDRHEHARQTNDTTYMRDEEYKLGFIFAMVGEDANDCEEEADGAYDWEWLRISRQVVGDWI